MPDKHLHENPVLTFWLWNVVFAAFFTFCRSFLKQEFRNPWIALATSVISMGTALFVGYTTESLGWQEWSIRISIAAGALLSYDVLRALINMGSRVDGDSLWSIIKIYTGQKSLPDIPPEKKDE